MLGLVDRVAICACLGSQHRRRKRVTAQMWADAVRAMSTRRLIIIAVTLVSLAVLPIVAPSARRKEESVRCGNYMASIGCAARLWADDHDNHLPSDLLSMSNEVIATKILICPGDHSRPAAASWATFTAANSSYEIVTPGLRNGDTNGVFLRCKIHGHLGFADATVFDGIRRRSKIP